MLPLGAGGVPGLALPAARPAAGGGGDRLRFSNMALPLAPIADAASSASNISSSPCRMLSVYLRPCRVPSSQTGARIYTVDCQRSDKVHRGPPSCGRQVSVRRPAAPPTLGRTLAPAAPPALHCGWAAV